MGCVHSIGPCKSQRKAHVHAQYIYRPIIIHILYTYTPGAGYPVITGCFETKYPAPDTWLPLPRAGYCPDSISRLVITGPNLHH
jgi:hypothetical protein